MHGSGRYTPLNKTINPEWTKVFLCGAPDIREDVVANLRTQIIRNLYKVEAELVAEKIVQNALYVL